MFTCRYRSVVLTVHTKVFCRDPSQTRNSYQATVRLGEWSFYSFFSVYDQRLVEENDLLKDVDRIVVSFFLRPLPAVMRFLGIGMGLQGVRLSNEEEDSKLTRVLIHHSSCFKQVGHV